MTRELMELLLQARNGIEREELIMGGGPEADFAEKVWDGLNGLIGCDPECSCELHHDDEQHDDDKILLFPIPR
jgi:hypothetical protein